MARSSITAGDLLALALPAEFIGKLSLMVGLLLLLLLLLPLLVLLGNLLAGSLTTLRPANPPEL